MHDRLSVHKFTSINDVPFSPYDYGLLKFGDDNIAKRFGHELAIKTFEKYSTRLLLNDCLVVPSPYNYVRNAATVMTMHFINTLNHLLINNNGSHVEYATIPRKVSYINDYGFLTKEQREQLINGDMFYMDVSYFKGRLLIFIDDILITGTHENKLKSILADNHMSNDAIFLYYAEYLGGQADIESQLNSSAIGTLDNYAYLLTSNKCHMIVRPIKFMLSADPKEFKNFIGVQDAEFRNELYYNSLNEGYYRIPKYQQNLDTLKSMVKLQSHL